MNDLAAHTAPTLPAPALDRLQAWAQEARAALADSTQRACAVDSRVFAAWGREKGLETLPANAQTVAAFLQAESEAGTSVATIRRRAATISRMHGRQSSPISASTSWCGSR